jgi:hypothetical protein
VPHAITVTLGVALPDPREAQGVVYTGIVMKVVTVAATVEVHSKVRASRQGPPEARKGQAIRRHDYTLDESRVEVAEALRLANG